MISTRLLSCNVQASRQAMVYVGRNRFFLRDSESKVVPSLVINRNLYQTVKKRALEARSKLKKAEYPNNRPCPETGADECPKAQKKSKCKKPSDQSSQNVKSLNVKECGAKPPPPCPPQPNQNLKWMIALAVAGLGGLVALLLCGGKKKEPEPPKLDPAVQRKVPASSKDIPKKVPYLLIGGGTASFSAFRAIKSNDPKAKVLIISNELIKPYMRPPLSKELWSVSEPDVIPKDYRFKQWTGAERSLFFEPEEFFLDPTKLMYSENGGVAVAQGYTVKKIDPKKKIATLTDGTEIGYDKCLLATGCTPKNIPVFANASKDIHDKIMFYRSPSDFEKLKKYVDKNKSITVIGSGFLGSELCCSLAGYAKNKKLKINQIFQESGNMAKILPEYLSKWTTRKVEQMGVCVVPGVQVKEVCRERGGLKLTLSNGQIVLTDITVICVGCEANTDIATASGLEVDGDLGGFVVNAELEARQNLFVAGDASCFYDPLLGRRRLEHHDHSVVSGRLAGENMTRPGDKKAYEHQSMFWSDLGSGIGYEGIGRTEASLPTVGVFAYQPDVRSTSNLDVPADGAKPPKKEKSESKPSPPPPEVKPCDTPDIEMCPAEPDYKKGVIFYLKDDKIVGILLWNLFNRIGLARTIINENKSYKDLNEVAKLFEIHS